MGPIKPEDLDLLKEESIPEWVFELFNNAIVKDWDGKESVVKQWQIVRDMVASGKCLENDIFDKGYLDVESVYRKVGWNVVYKKADYFDRNSSSFLFSK